MNKKRKKLKPWIYNLITAVLVGVILFSGYNIFSIKFDEDKTIKIQNEYKLPIVNAEVEDKETYTERYNKLKEKNSDFKGWVSFESGLIDLPFLQYTDNDFYLNKNFEKERSSHGSVFLDYQQDLDGENVTLYGHYVYNNSAIMFTPLEVLKNQSNYEQNKYVSLYLENTVRKYQVVAIFKYNLTDEPIYQIGNMSDEKFNEYINYIKTHQLYNTGVEINSGDKLLSLQTCVRGDNDSRWVVVSKLIEEKGIE